MNTGYIKCFAAQATNLETHLLTNLTSDNSDLSVLAKKRVGKATLERGSESAQIPSSLPVGTYRVY